MATTELPLTAAQLAVQNAKPHASGGVVREPTDNRYGDLRVLRRVDGLCVVHNDKPSVWPPNGPVFRTEAGAREWAKAHAK